MTILVSGATGTVGRHVVDALLEKGEAVRALTRRPETAALPSEVDVRRADFERPDTLDNVFDDVDTFFLVPSEHTVSSVAARAHAGHVNRIVLLSSATAGDSTDSAGVGHRAIEEIIEGSGAAWTHLRPGMFASNLLDWAEPIRASHAVRQPYGDVAQAPVHEKDVAAVAAAALTDVAHTGKIYHLTGPESLTKPEQLQAIAAGTGLRLTFEELTPDQWRSEVGDKMPPFVIEWLLALWAQGQNQPEHVLRTVEEVTSRPARTLTEWAKDHSAVFV